jgi:inhibitor of cysteine peptidase
MKNLNAIILLLVLLVSASACGGSDKMKQFTSDDNGKTIEVNAGGSFTVILSSNPTTGYGWSIDQLDPIILQQVGEAVYAPESKDEKLVGSGGNETFTFKALASGQTDLKLTYHRPWETDVPPIETFMVTIMVK